MGRLYRIIFAAAAGGIAAAALLMSGIGPAPRSHADGGEDTAAEASSAVSALAGSVRPDSYEAYLSRFASAAAPAHTIRVPGPAYAAAEGEVEFADDPDGGGAPVLVTGETGFVEWEIRVPETGLYHLALTYYPVPGKGASIERELRIDGTVPFEEANSIVLPRIWKDAERIRRDNRGNDLTPKQMEAPAWRETVLRDEKGYYVEPYRFYFTEGVHRIALASVREPLAIKEWKLVPVETPPEYAQVEREYRDRDYRPAPSGTQVKVQGEQTLYKSDPMLVPVYDRSSPATEPYDTSKLRLNIFGGDRWSVPGQSASWELNVPEAGLYRIAVKARQNGVQGSVVNRRLLLNGEVPFKEAEYVEFAYSSSWQMHVLGGEEPYLFYLDKGRNVLTLEVSLGKLSDYLRIAESSVLALNDAYRDIIMITGTTPDPFRDYQLDVKIPETIETLRRQSGILKELSRMIKQHTGRTSSKTALLDTLSRQLAGLAERPEEIPIRLDAFKTNTAALGTWIVELKHQPLEIDYILAFAPDTALPRADATLWEKIVHEWKALVASFTEDYSTIGNTAESGRTITVWTSTGRDQAQVLKNLIDSSFTPATGIQVNLKLVQPEALLPAVVARIGPDVALETDAGTPVDYAIRNAVEDLTQFPDFPEVARRFRESALVPFTFRDGVYALPETQSFPMLFYRKDILEELGLDVPQSWDDVYAMLPVLHRVNMNMGVPVDSADSSMLSMGIMLYQSGGQFYRDGGKASGLDEETAIQAFKRWTELYTNYKLPLVYDFANRFRTGEMPVGIADYTLFNTLTVFAPEIRGLWGFAPVPGTRRADGTLDHSAPGGGTAAILLKTAKDKEAGWEFLKWWTSEETQVEFGRGMESLLGAAARYPTANIAAMNRLPWAVRDTEQLTAQWEWVVGIPQVPGGYFTGRHLNNAFRQVINTGEDPREVMLDYVRVINQEISIKRREFGLE